MPQVEPAKRHSDKRPMLIGIGVVVLIALIISGVLVAQLLLKDTTTQTKQAESQALKQSFQGNHDAATATLEKQLSEAKTDKEKLDLYLALGQNYMMAKNYKAAVGVYKKAAEIEPGFGTNEAIAKAAEMGGDKALALDYYQRNRTIIKDGKADLRAGELERVEKAIVRLGGKL